MNRLYKSRLSPDRMSMLALPVTFSGGTVVNCLFNRSRGELFIPIDVECAEGDVVQLEGRQMPVLQKVVGNTVVRFLLSEVLP